MYDLADVQRHGYDLHSVLTLTLYDALLGASVPVKTVRGHRNIKVPAGRRVWRVDLRAVAACVCCLWWTPPLYCCYCFVLPAHFQGRPLSLG